MTPPIWMPSVLVRTCRRWLATMPTARPPIHAQDRQISSAGDAIAHDGGELRNPNRGNNRIIPKDAPEVVLIWKNFILHWQKYAGEIDQINQWQIVFECDPLRAN